MELKTYAQVPTMKMHMKTLEVPVITRVVYGPRASMRRITAAGRRSMVRLSGLYRRLLHERPQRNLVLLSSAAEGRNISQYYALHYDSSAQGDLNRCALWVQTGPSFCLTSHITPFLLIYLKWHQL